jgi:hypothetical protein
MPYKVSDFSQLHTSKYFKFFYHLRTISGIISGIIKLKNCNNLAEVNRDSFFEKSEK